MAPHFSVQLADPNAEVVSELGNRDLRGLHELSRVTRLPTIVADRTLKRVYAFECDITEIVVRVADKTLHLVGYSDKALIRNYQDIVKHLLAADLVALKKAVASVPWRFWGTPTQLITVTRQFLASEVNVQIDDPAHLRERIIDTAYIKEAKGLLRAALGRIFSAGMGPALLYTAVSPSLVFVAGHMADMWSHIGGWAVVPLAGAAWLPLIVCERRVRTRLSAAFERSGGQKITGLGRKVDGLLPKYHVLGKLRTLALALATAVLAVTAYTPTLSFTSRAGVVAGETV